MLLSRKLNGLVTFNHEPNIVYENADPTPDGEWLIVDTSASMLDHEKVLKMSFSAMMAIYGKVGQLHLPRLCGGTGLIATIDAIATKVGAGGRVTVISDCYDMVHRNKTRDVSISVTPDGTIEFADLETYNEMESKLPPHPTAQVLATGASPEQTQATLDAWRVETDSIKQDWASRWFNVCLKHLQFVGVNVAIIGIGTEIQDVIFKAIGDSSVRVNLAWLPSNATVEQVSSVVVAAHRRGQAEKGTPSPIVITADAPEAQPGVTGVTEAVVAAVSSSAVRVRVGDSLNVDALKDLLVAAESHEYLKDASYDVINKAAARTAHLWFLDLALKTNQPLAGGLMGGMRGRIFLDPDSGGVCKTTWHKYLNAGLSALSDGKGGLGLYASQKKLSSNIKIGEGDESLYFKFNDAPHYSVKLAIDADVITALKTDATFAPPESTLTRVTCGNSSFSKYDAAVTGVDKGEWTSQKRAKIA